MEDRRNAAKIYALFSYENSVIWIVESNMKTLAWEKYFVSFRMRHKEKITV